MTNHWRATLTVCFVLAVSAAIEAQVAPAVVRVDPAAALKQVRQKVDPVFPSEVVAANPGAVVAADVIISANGTVESVTMVSGPSALEAPAMAALQRWTFTPFVINGRPTRVRTLIDFALPDHRRDADLKTSNDFWSARNACERALATRAGNLETVCAELVRRSDSLAADRVLERMDALHLHGVSLLLANRPADALHQFEGAISARRKVTGSSDDADMGGLLSWKARAHVALGDMAAADAAYTEAVATTERALIAVPNLRDQYQDRLTEILRQQADVKRALGQSAAGRAIDERVAASTAAATPVLLPSMRRVGETFLLGSVGPLLTDDDLRQLRGLAPAGKKAWLVVAGSNRMVPNLQLQVQVYLEPDSIRPDLRRGRVILAEAAIPETANLDVKKTWKKMFDLSYAQVPIAGRDPMDIRGNNDVNLPARVGNTPAGSLTDEEVVSIVTFLRSLAKDSARSEPSSTPASLFTNVQQWPIEDMMRWSDGEVHVTLAAHETLRDARQRIRLKPSGSAGWQVVELQPFGY